MVTLHHGDCLEFMRTLPAGSVDAVVTDPPYGIGYDPQQFKKWSGGSGTVGAYYVQWSAFTMAAAGDYEIRLSVLVSGNKRTDIQRIKVVA